MATCLELVTDQFPHLKDRIARLFEDDVIFRELCEDYEVCTRTRLGQTASEALQREYAALSLRLEFELLRFVQESEGAPEPERGKEPERGTKEQ